MGALTQYTPKPLLKIGSSPILAFSLASLPNQISEVLIITNYLKEQIMDWASNLKPEIPITFFHQPYFSGTGGAVFEAASQNKVQWPCLVLNGDDLYAKNDLSVLCELGRTSFVMQGFERIGPVKSSIKVAEGLVVGFEDTTENQKSLQCTGAYALHEAFAEASPISTNTHGNSEISLPHTLMATANQIHIQALSTKNWLRVGTPEELARANELYKTGMIKPAGNIFTEEPLP